MKKKKILITDKVHPILIEGLRDGGAVVDYHPKMSYPDVKSIVTDYDGLIINSKVICDRAFIDQAGHLDFVGRLGSGLDIIDLPYAGATGLQVISSPEGNANAVAEHAMGMLLSLLHNLGRSHEDVKAMNWNREPNRGTELRSKTIGIIGFGHTGPAFASKLAGFDVQILAYDKYRSGYTQTFDFVSESSIEEIQAQADIISIHLPLTDETRFIINGTWLGKCSKKPIIINTSRGAILNSKDLLHLLEDGTLTGACLDVLENEVPSSWKGEQKTTYTQLLERNDVIVTPHIAGWTHQSLQLIASILLDKIQRYYQLNEE